MALEIRHNRAKHTHENIQFRRIAKGLKVLFEQNGWDGLLIGNPESETFSRFKADAILLYNYGLIIIDFKDYSGVINIPPNDEDFRTTKWYNETETDKRRIEIKAGSRFINPFMQLDSYRKVMYEIIRSNEFLRNNIDPSQVCSVNIFSGPITTNRNTPRSLSYYKILQESELYNFLYDYSSRNKYSDEIADIIKTLFEAEEWQDLETTYEPPQKERIIEIERDVENEIKTFFKERKNGIIVLESMDVNQRDKWMQFILSESVNYDNPQTEVWTHSTRISRRISERSGINPKSLYNTIYGGGGQYSEDNIYSSDNNESDEENIQEIVPIKSNEEIDDAAIIVLHEAHLVTRSLHQTELLRFGSGRLLDDLLKFLSLESNKRKLICIGDPYSLSFGREEECALSLVSLEELYNGDIKHYRYKPQLITGSNKEALKSHIAISIENDIFNNLAYKWDDESLVKIESHKVENILKDWFGNISESEPENTVLVYSNHDARKINLLIKQFCLNNGDDLNCKDLLLAHNNINIPDASGFGYPTKIYNGMYLLVKEKIEDLNIPIKIKQFKEPIILSFTKLLVQCLSLHNKPVKEVWLLNNYFNSDDRLTLNELIALRVLMNQKVNEEIKRNPFENSREFVQLQNDHEYLKLKEEEHELKYQINKGKRLKTKLEEKQKQIRKIERLYKRKHRQKAIYSIVTDDPIVNALFARYGWAITVHKSVGSTFKNIIFNAVQEVKDREQGYHNANYFRWVYSALNCSESSVYITNPVEIDPLRNCHFEDIAGGDTTKKQHQMLKKFIFSKYDATPIAQQLDSSLIGNVKGAIYHLTKCLEQQGFILDETEQRGDYLSKAIYSTPDSYEKNLIIAINNNSKGEVTSIRIEKYTGANESVVNECIDSLIIYHNKLDSEKDIEWPEDFRKEIYDLWKTKCNSDGWHLKLIESHSYQDIFLVEKGNRNIKFRVYYNGKGFFTKFSVFEKSHSALGEQLYSMLVYGK